MMRAEFQPPPNKTGEQIIAAYAPSIVGASGACCGTASSNKFCPACSQPMNAKLHCKSCGTELEGKPKFSKEYGSKEEFFLLSFQTFEAVFNVLP